MTRRAYHHGNLRAALLDRAEVTLRERGVEGLSLRELARDVGVSHAAPRRHFADRRQLLDALAGAGFERLGRELRHALDRADAGFADRLVAAGRAYVLFATRDAALLEVMFAGKHRDPEGPLRDAADNAFAPLLALVVEGQEQGRLQAGDPVRTGMVVFAALQGLASLANGGMLDPALLDDFAEEAVTRLVRLAPAGA